MRVRSAETLLREEARDVSGWSNGPGDTYAEHEHLYRKVLVCVRGSIEFRLGGGETIRLAAGDRLVLEPGTRHSAVVGPDGCTCVEGRA